MIIDWVIGIGLWISTGGFFFFLGDRCGVWVIGVGLWCLMVWVFFLVLMVDYGLLVVVVVSGVCSAVVVGGGGHVMMVFSVKFVVVEQKE